MRFKAKIVTHISAVLILAAGFALSAPVSAQAQATDALTKPVSVHIAGGSLADALIAFSRQTGVQVITAGSTVRNFSTHGVEGEMPAQDALRHLLEGTSLSFRSLGPNTVGVEVPTPTSGHAYRATSLANSELSATLTSNATTTVNDSTAHDQASAKDNALEEIIVTSRKQRESVIDVPESITVLSGDVLAQLGVASFSDYATKVPGLSFSYGTGSLGFASSRTVAIRGISGIGTTALYVDDTPVDEAMDPRVLDVERIEVLKAPQGTLFGEGSLGGAVRLVTQKPNFSGSALSYGGQAGGTSHGGSADYGANITTNFVPIDGTLAVRALAFVSHDAGFVTRTFPDAQGQIVSRNNQGAALSYGGSLSILYRPVTDLEVLARLLGQAQDNNGLPVTYAPLPAFKPDDLTMSRTVDIQEYARDHWIMPTLQITYEGQGWSVVSATSYLDRGVSETENGTEGTITASQNFFGYTPDPVVESWRQTFGTQRFTEELRTTITSGSRWSGTFGVYYSNDRVLNTIGPYTMPGLPASGLFPTDLGWYSAVRNRNTDTALFGEVYLHPFDAVTLTLGFRKYWLRQHYSFRADGLFNGGETPLTEIPNSQTGVSPKAALEYKLSPTASVYASAAKGFRAGGGTTPLPSFCESDLANLGLTTDTAARYNSDGVWSYEVGAKAQLLDRRLLVTSAAFQVNWTDIQQPVFLPTCGFTFTTNAGAARSRGVEFELSGRLAAGLEARIGMSYVDAKITEQGRSNQVPGSRINEVPKITATAALNYSRPLTPDLVGSLSTDLSYVGNSVSAVSSLLSPLTRPSYTVLNMRIGLAHGPHEWTFYANNITNERANFGDINPISYVRYVDGQILPRVSVMRPFSLGLRYTRGF